MKKAGIHQDELPGGVEVLYLEKGDPRYIGFHYFVRRKGEERGTHAANKPAAIRVAWTVYGPTIERVSL